MAMTPKERVEAVINGEKPDRVPIWQLNGIVGSQNHGIPWKDVRDNPKLATEVGIKFLRECGSDIITYVGVEPNAPLTDLDMEFKFVDNNYSNVMSHLFNEPEDVDKKQFYDPMNKSECPKFWLYQMEKVKMMIENENPDEYHTQVLSWSIMTTAGHLRGVEQLLMDIVMEPDLAHKVMKRSMELLNNTITTGLEIGATNAYIADPSASGSLINAEMFDEFCAPYIKPAIAKWKSKYKVPVFLHVCGETEPVIEAFKKIEPDVFSFDYMTDMCTIRDAVDNKIVMAGNLNPMDVIWQGTPDLIIEEAKKVFERADGKRLFLATGCESPRDTPTANLAAMKTACEQFGRY